MTTAEKRLANNVFLCLYPTIVDCSSIRCADVFEARILRSCRDVGTGKLIKTADKHRSFDAPVFSALKDGTSGACGAH